MDDLLGILKSEFNEHVDLREKRPNVMQVIAPLYHEDGDMLDIFIDVPRNAGDPIQISDHGLTLMRLSYSYEVDSPTKRKILSRILSENGIEEFDGRLFIGTTPKTLYPDLMQFAQTVAKVCNMKLLKREIIQSLFYETLNDFVSSTLMAYRPQPHYMPLPERDDLDVDWRFPSPLSKDVFLYGVRDTAKARLAVLSCLEYQAKQIPFRSLIIHEDFESSLTKKDQSRITNIADKQFTTLDDFRENAEQYFAREIHQSSLN
jgi:Domain of unknown function DUF1828